MLIGYAKWIATNVRFKIVFRQCHKNVELNRMNLVSLFATSTLLNTIFFLSFNHIYQMLICIHFYTSVVFYRDGTYIGEAKTRFFLCCSDICCYGSKSHLWTWRVYICCKNYNVRTVRLLIACYRACVCFASKALDFRSEFLGTNGVFGVASRIFQFFKFIIVFWHFAVSASCFMTNQDVWFISFCFSANPDIRINI